MNISFVVVARNELPEHVETTINGIVETSAGTAIEIVLVDDGSSVPICLNRPEVRVIRNAPPIGTCQSRRLGASFATGDVLVSMDAHMRFASDWLDHMLARVDTGALLCAAWWDYELSRPLCWGADFLWCGERDYHAGRCPGISFRHRTAPPGEHPIEVPMLIGACYMMLRTSYEKLGGFSPFFRTWGKLEQDLSTRAWILGLGVQCIPAAHVGHFSRTKFPYPVRWEDIEFNQAATARTVFEEPVARKFEELLQPLPLESQIWLDTTDFSAWRSFIQSRRTISDAEFFRRFIPDAPKCLRQAMPAALSGPSQAALSESLR